MHFKTNWKKFFFDNTKFTSYWPGLSVWYATVYSLLYVISYNYFAIQRGQLYIFFNVYSLNLCLIIPGFILVQQARSQRSDVGTGTDQEEDHGQQWLEVENSRLQDERKIQTQLIKCSDLLISSVPQNIKIENVYGHICFLNVFDSLAEKLQTWNILHKLYVPDKWKSCLITALIIATMMFCFCYNCFSR